MDWLFLVLISVVISSFANIIQRVMMKGDKSDPISYSVVFCFLLGIFFMLFAIPHGFHLPPLNGNLIFIFLAAIFWGVGNIALFKSLQFLESSEVTILISVRALVTIIVSIIFLHEVFNVQKSIGTIIILSSILLVANVKKGFKFNNGVHFAFLCALFYGIAIVCDVFNLRSYDLLSYLAVVNIIMGFMLLAIYPKTLKQLKTFTKPRFLWTMLPLSALTGFQALFYYFALAKGHVSQIAPINQTQVIITVLLAAILLSERDHLLKKIIAAFLVMGGVLLLR